jgi:hypothetical protein
MHFSEWKLQKFALIPTKKVSFFSNKKNDTYPYVLEIF